MNAQQAYEWLAPKLSKDEREALDVIMGAIRDMEEDIDSLQEERRVFQVAYHGRLAE